MTHHSVKKEIILWAWSTMCDFFKKTDALLIISFTTPVWQKILTSHQSAKKILLWACLFHQKIKKNPTSHLSAKKFLLWEQILLWAWSTMWMWHFQVKFQKHCQFFPTQLSTKNNSCITPVGQNSCCEHVCQPNKTKKILSSHLFTKKILTASAVHNIALIFF